MMTWDEFVTWLGDVPIGIWWALGGLIGLIVGLLR